MPFVSYLRVSTARQGESGLGLEAQRSSVAAFLAAQGGTAIAEYVEVESGKLRDRPILQQALRHCRRERATLVIAKLDRLARNVAFVSSLMEAKTEFVAVDAPYANRLMIHILAAFAEHEREQIAARTRGALAAAKARGVRLGANGAVLAETRRTAAVEYAETLRSTLRPLCGRGLTLAALAGELNRRGVETREGAAWSATTVRRVLLRLDLHSPQLPLQARQEPPWACPVTSANLPNLSRETPSHAVHSRHFEPHSGGILPRADPARRLAPG